MAGPMKKKTAPSSYETGTKNDSFKTQSKTDSKVTRTEKTWIPKSST